MNDSLFWATLYVFLLTLPFGYWRASVKKLSWKWFLFIHLPIPFIIFLRFYFELGFSFYTFLFLDTCFILGQFIGGKLYLKFKKPKEENQK